MTRDPSLLVGWCDDLFLQGHQLAAWIVDYVDVEESLAMGSMAQDHLAHTAALLAACGFSTLDRDRHIYQRPAADWHPSRVSLMPPGVWPATVARQFLFNRATLVLRCALHFPGRPRMEQLAEVIRAEQGVHSAHWERWLRIVQKDDDLAQEFSEYLHRAAEDAADIFGLAPAAAELPMLKLSPQEMHDQWVREVSTTLEDVGLPVPELSTGPVPRASGDGLPSLDSILEELRFCRGPDGAPSYEVYR